MSCSVTSNNRGGGDPCLESILDTGFASKVLISEDF